MYLLFIQVGKVGGTLTIISSEFVHIEWKWCITFSWHQKQNNWLINGVMHHFHSMLIMLGAILNSELRVVHVLLTFWNSNLEGHFCRHEVGKQDFCGKGECPVTNSNVTSFLGQCNCIIVARSTSGAAVSLTEWVILRIEDLWYSTATLPAAAVHLKLTKACFLAHFSTFWTDFQVRPVQTPSLHNYKKDNTMDAKL